LAIPFHAAPAAECQAPHWRDKRIACTSGALEEIPQ